MIKEAIEEDLAEGYREMDARELRKLSQVFFFFLFNNQVQISVVFFFLLLFYMVVALKVKVAINTQVTCNCLGQIDARQYRVRELG